MDGLAAEVAHERVICKRAMEACLAEKTARAESERRVVEATEELELFRARAALTPREGGGADGHGVNTAPAAAPDAATGHPAWTTVRLSCAQSKYRKSHPSSDVISHTF